MSVREADRNVGNYAAVTAAKQLCEHTQQVTDNRKWFPESHPLTWHLQEKALSIYARLIEAGELRGDNVRDRETRRQAKRMAAAECRSLLALVDLARIRFSFPAKRAQYWARMIRETRTSIITWLQTEAR